jgi:hypothetical protein
LGLGEDLGKNEGKNNSYTPQRSVKNHDKKLLKWNHLANEELIKLTYDGNSIQGCKYT